jgi:hypothetical protein
MRKCVLEGHELAIHKGSTLPSGSKECVLVDIARVSDGKRWQAATKLIMGRTESEIEETVVEFVGYALAAYVMDTIDFRFELPDGRVQIQTMPWPHVCRFHPATPAELVQS